MKVAILYYKPSPSTIIDASFRKYLDKIERTVEAVSKHFKVVSPGRADFGIAICGDGPMTRFAKKYPNLPIYGVNRGTYGFLLNNHDDDADFVKALSEAVWVDFPLLDAEIHLQNGKVKSALAFNDIYTKTTTPESAKHRISINGYDILGEESNGRERIYSGDGIIVCTPGGSTAYNRAAKGIILDHKSTSLGLTPISPFFPNGFNPQLISGDSVVVIEMVDDAKRRHMVIADNIAFRKVHHVVVRKAEKTAKLGFKPTWSYFAKTMELRFPWLKDQGLEIRI